MKKIIFDKITINILSFVLGLKTVYSPRFYNDNSIGHTLYITNDNRFNHKIGTYGFWITESSISKMYSAACKKICKISLKIVTDKLKRIFYS